MIVLNNIVTILQTMNDWVFVCNKDQIDFEDLIRFDHNDKTFCIYNIKDGFLRLMVFALMKKFISKMVWLQMMKLNAQCTKEYLILKLEL